MTGESQVMCAKAWECPTVLDRRNPTDIVELPTKAIRVFPTVPERHLSPHLVTARLLENLIGVKCSFPLCQVKDAGKKSTARTQREEVVSVLQLIAVPDIPVSTIRNDDPRACRARRLHFQRRKYALV